MYEKCKDDKGRHYLKRNAICRGRPNMPGLVRGEEMDINTIKPNMKYVSAVTVGVKKG